MSTVKINKNKICLHVLPYDKSDLIRKGQFALDDLPIKKIKEFIRLLFCINSDIDGAYTWFDKLDSCISPRREFDEDMDLDKFLSLLTPKGFIRLQTGDPFHDEIRFMAEDRPKGDGIAHFAWFTCSLTIENYKKLDGLFNEAFGFRLKELC